MALPTKPQSREKTRPPVKPKVKRVPDHQLTEEQQAAQREELKRLHMEKLPAE